MVISGFEPQDRLIEEIETVLDNPRLGTGQKTEQLESLLHMAYVPADYSALGMAIRDSLDEEDFSESAIDIYRRSNSMHEKALTALRGSHPPRMDMFRNFEYGELGYNFRMIGIIQKRQGDIAGSAASYTNAINYLRRVVNDKCDTETALNAAINLFDCLVEIDDLDQAENFLNYLRGNQVFSTCLNQMPKYRAAFDELPNILASAKLIYGLAQYHRRAIGGGPGRKH